MPRGVLDAADVMRLVGDGGGEDGGDLVVGEVEAGLGFGEGGFECGMVFTQGAQVMPSMATGWMSLSAVAQKRGPP